MSDAFDDRRRGLEEEYFSRKNKEAIEKLRQKMKVAEQAKAAGESSMRCPRCTGTLVETKFEGIFIDRCDNCSGIWLDPGEFAELAKKDSSNWFDRWWGGD
jgi:Zn-finger nucleic acid-binding protein